MASKSAIHWLHPSLLERVTEDKSHFLFPLQLLYFRFKKYKSNIDELQNMYSQQLGKYEARL